ncbi:MAG: sigma-70 family RNA polymerase sigma factor [Pyrinomonadaceae bacterium]
MLGLKWLESGEDKWQNFQTEAMPFSKDLYRVAMWLTRNPTEAEDLVQETMFQAMRSFHGYELGTNCRAWLMTIMHNMNAKRLRNLGRLTLIADTEDRIAETIAFEPSIPESITDEEVLEALREVPQHFRDVIVLSDVEDFSYKEISTILNLPMGTVMSRLHRARKLLRLRLADYAKNFGFGENRQAAGN